MIHSIKDILKFPHFGSSTVEQMARAGRFKGCELEVAKSKFPYKTVTSIEELNALDELSNKLAAKLVELGDE